MPHQRKRSGHGLANTSTTDVRKAIVATEPTKLRRPVVSRRQTPVNVQKLSKTQRERERDQQDSWQHLETESFPQFCMTCERQILPQGGGFLYCSEACRGTDRENHKRGSHEVLDSIHSYSHLSDALTQRNESSSKDIVPQASPSRPNSTYFSSSPLTASTPDSRPKLTSALSSLRSLNIRPPSPSSPTDGVSSGIWPFSRSVATRHSPSTSYTRPPTVYLSTTFDTKYGDGSYTYNGEARGTDRPLPSRQSARSARPKSIELVTPMVGP